MEESSAQSFTCREVEFVDRHAVEKEYLRLFLPMFTHVLLGKRPGEEVRVNDCNFIFFFRFVAAMRLPASVAALLKYAVVPIPSQHPRKKKLAAEREGRLATSK